MSGSGLIDPVGAGMRARLEAAERDRDTLAYLRRRQANAEAIASATSESDELHEFARDRARQISIQIEEIEQGLHHGCAAVEAQIQAGETVG